MTDLNLPSGSRQGRLLLYPINLTTGALSNCLSSMTVKTAGQPTSPPPSIVRDSAPIINASATKRETAGLVAYTMQRAIPLQP